jgi:hypothetical protein
MIKEFIPYQQALDLKELGFDEPCFGHYQQEWHDDGMTELEPSLQMVISKQHQHAYQIYTAPLYQQAFRWFREKYNISGEVNKNDKQMIDYVASKGEKYLPLYYWSYCKDNGVSGGTANTYEEAELACLIKLIEIVKDGKSKSNS